MISKRRHHTVRCHSKQWLYVYCDAFYGTCNTIKVSLGSVDNHTVPSAGPGGHGADDCATRYVAMLKMDFNTECIHQVPRSLFINVFNLGVWDTLQSEVERRYFVKRCHIKALVSIVMTTWDECKLDQQITNVLKILEKIL